MKQTGAILVVLAVIGSVLVGSAYSLMFKAKYDQVRDDIGTLYHVVPMSRETDAFLAEVRETWTEQQNISGIAHAQILGTIGLAPTIAHLLHVLSHPMPPYSWVSPLRNRDAIRFGVVQGVIRPTSIDRTVHVSADGQWAMIRCSTNAVSLFVEDAAGLRLDMYFRPKVESNLPTEGVRR